MNPGKLDSRITLQRRSTSRDAAGQPLDSWEPVASVWASIKFLTGTASIRADRVTARAGVSIRVRWRADVCTGMQAVHNTTVFLVQSVHPQGRDWLDLVCEVPQ